MGNTKALFKLKSLELVENLLKDFDCDAKCFRDILNKIIEFLNTYGYNVVKAPSILRYFYKMETMQETIIKPLLSFKDVKDDCKEFDCNNPFYKLINSENVISNIEYEKELDPLMLFFISKVCFKIADDLWLVTDIKGFNEIKKLYFVFDLNKEVKNLQLFEEISTERVKFYKYNLQYLNRSNKSVSLMNDCVIENLEIMLNEQSIEDFEPDDDICLEYEDEEDVYNETKSEVLMGELKNFLLKSNQKMLFDEDEWKNVYKKSMFVINSAYEISNNKGGKND